MEHKESVKGHGVKKKRSNNVSRGYEKVSGAHETIPCEHEKVFREHEKVSRELDKVSCAHITGSVYV